MISNYAPLLELYSFILMPLPGQGRSRSKAEGKGSYYHTCRERAKWQTSSGKVAAEQPDRLLKRTGNIWG